MYTPTGCDWFGENVMTRKSWGFTYKSGLWRTSAQRGREDCITVARTHARTLVLWNHPLIILYHERETRFRGGNWKHQTLIGSRFVQEGRPCRGL